MVTLQLTDAEAVRLLEMLETHARDLRHEIHHTDDRAFRGVLREKEAMVERLLFELRQHALAPEVR